MIMRKSRKAQVAQLPQEKQAEYFHNRRRAIAIIAGKQRKKHERLAAAIRTENQPI